MTTPEETPSERPTIRPGNYGEISPGVPRYGQYAPEGWVSPVAADQTTQHTVGSSTGLPPSAAYPGFSGTQNVIKGPGATNDGPAKVRTFAAARFIQLAGIIEAIGIVLSIVALLTPAGKAAYLELWEQTVASFPAASVEMPDQATILNMVIITTAVLGAIMVAGYFFVANKIRKGSNAARITGLVLTVLSVVTVFGGNPINIVRVLICVYAMVILFRAPAKDYFLPKSGGGQNGLPRG